MRACARAPAGRARTCSEHVVRVAHKLHRHDAVGVRKQAAVAVAKVEPPHPDVLVGGARDQQPPVGRNVHRQHRQLVAVQGQEELEAVGEEHLDGGVQKRDRQQLACADGVRVDAWEGTHKRRGCWDVQRVHFTTPVPPHTPSHTPVPASTPAFPPKGRAF